MTKNIKFFLGILTLFSLSILFLSCGVKEDEILPKAPDEIQDGYVRVNFENSEGIWSVWAWKDIDSSEKSKCKTWPNGIPFTYTNGNYICVDIKLNENPNCVGLIIVNNTGKKGSGDNDVLFYFPKKYNEIYIKNGQGTIYVDKECTREPVGTSAANITGTRKITLNCNGVTLSDNTISLKDRNGNDVAISNYSGNVITTSENIKSIYASKAPFSLSAVDDEGNTDIVTVGIDGALVESWFGTNAVDELISSGSKMGVTISGNKASFKTWAPIAAKVTLLLFKDANQLKNPDSTEEMSLSGAGFWTIENVDISSYKYYKYRIVNSGVEKDVCDIWHTVASADSVASQIVSIDDSSTKPENWETEYTNPFGDSGSIEKKYSDAIIYEMHIRDWSRAYVADSTGKFSDITANLGDTGAFAKHLQDLGVTHVQILPMFDYAQTNDDLNYNWGYNPYHYNVPEGRYVKDMKNGSDAVIQMREMIKAFHDAGISVIMDVVYNHTSGTESNSLYDMTIPGYFYRINDQGAYVNGSGCGNEVATNHAMVKRYVIESLKHWMNDYHINGFRFDLMGCLEASTMKSIYDSLYAIDKNVLVYGEPWTGGTSDVQNGAKQAGSGTNGLGYGAFDDDFRDAIKGPEFGGFGKGQIQGEYNDEGILNGLTGKSGKNKRGVDGKPGLSLHYVECHDNYTLADKLCYSTLSGLSGEKIVSKFVSYDSLSTTNKDLIRAQNKLAAAYVFLAQGTPFINGGQEFMRTKKGNPDSYASDEKGGKFWSPSEIDECNTVNLSYKKKFEDVYKVYKGLIALRKDNPNAFGANTTAVAEVYNKTAGVTKYTTGDFLVYFNATDKSVEIESTGYTKVIDVTSGTPTESTPLPTSVPAKSFVILKK